MVLAAKSAVATELCKASLIPTPFSQSFMFTIKNSNLRWDSCALVHNISPEASQRTEISPSSFTWNLYRKRERYLVFLFERWTVIIFNRVPLCATINLNNNGFNLIKFQLGIEGKIIFNHFSIIILWSIACLLLLCTFYLSTYLNSSFSFCWNIFTL